MRSLTEYKIHLEKCVKYGTRHEKLMGRMELDGIDSLSLAEQVEFYLWCCKPKKGMDVKAVAERMVERFPWMHDLIYAPVKELMQVEGMYRGLAQRYTEIGEMLDVYRMTLATGWNPKIRNTRELFPYAVHLFDRCPFSGTYLICLSEGWHFMHCEEIVPSIAWGEEDAIDNARVLMEFTGSKYAIVMQIDNRAGNRPKKYDFDHVKVFAAAMEKHKFKLVDVALYNGANMWSMFELGRMGMKGEKEYPAVEPPVRRHE